MMEELKKYVRSYVPGRLRLRHPGLKNLDAETMSFITSTVTSAAGITGCAINPEVGSLLLTWDRKALTEEDLMGYLSFWAAFIPEDAVNAEPVGLADKALEETSVTKRLADGRAAGCKAAAELAAKARLYTNAGLDVLSPYVAPDQKGAARRRRVTQNRLMLAAGAGSIALLVMRSSAHASLGWLFAAMAAVHLYQHRTVI